MMTINRNKTLATLAFVTALAACGGGGGGSSEPGTDADGDGTMTGEDENIGGETGNGGPTDDMDGQDDDTMGGEMDPDNMDDPMPAPGTGDVAVTLTSGRDARIIATQGGPVIGVPGATLSSLSETDVHPAGFLVYSADYRTPGNTSNLSGLWAGPAAAPSLLLRANASIDGLPESVRFGGAENVEIASDGSVALIANLSGSRETSAVLTAEGAEPSVLLESGTALMGLTQTKTIVSFNELTRSAAGTAFSASTSDNQAGLWISDETGLTAIAESRDLEVNNAPSLGSCRIFLERFRSPESVPHLLDDGSLVFQAQLGTYQFNSTDACIDGQAVVRYTAGTYTSVVSPGDIVPGSTASTFTSIALRGVSPSGSVIVEAVVSTPTGDFRPDTRWSFWLFPIDGAPRLIALQGEAVQLGDVQQTLSGDQRSVDVNASGQVAVRVNFDDRNRSPAIFGGNPHLGQPHGAISAPGASALTFLVDSSVVLPAPFLPSTFFSATGVPKVDSTGNVTFIGRVTDSELGREVLTTAWRVDLEGNIEALIAESDTAPVAGVSRSLTDLLELTSFQSEVRVQVSALNNGGFVFAENNSFRRSESLIYLGPDSTQ